MIPWWTWRGWWWHVWNGLKLEARWVRDRLWRRWRAMADKTVCEGLEAFLDGRRELVDEPRREAR